MLTRAADLDALCTRAFDLLVVGGGITGAGIARDAAMRGLAVACIDKGDFASGTSSRSSRLIHGGVRYLEHGHLHLVFEASAERRRLLRLAPRLVRPLPFVWPVYEGARLPLWKIAAGLTLYDLLALFRNVEPHERLDAREVLEREPRLEPRGLTGGVRYFDAATDDVRLTLANALDARRRGAVMVNHVAYTGAAPDVGDHRVSRVEDALTGRRMEVRARVLVNAAGPWSDRVGSLAGLPDTRRVQGSKGAHLAVPRDRVGNRDAVVLLHPDDGRVMFALPAGAHTLIGTTDTFTDVSPDEVRASEADVAYLLRAANAAFHDARLERADVVAAWAGIRPLMPSAGTSVQASREHAIETPAPWMVAVTGGKLTTYRIMAAQVVDVVGRLLGARRAKTPTRDEPLPGETVDATGELVVPDLPYRMDQLRHAVRHELACTLGDLLIRRTQIAFATRDNGRAAARRVVGAVASLIGWDGAAQERELSRYDAEVDRIFTIDP